MSSRLVRNLPPIFASSLTDFNWLPSPSTIWVQHPMWQADRKLSQPRLPLFGDWMGKYSRRKRRNVLTCEQTTSITQRISLDNLVSIHTSSRTHLTASSTTRQAGLGERNAPCLPRAVAVGRMLPPSHRNFLGVPCFALQGVLHRKATFFQSGFLPWSCNRYCNQGIFENVVLLLGFRLRRPNLET
jgi:hypothetical protein